MATKVDVALAPLLACCVSSAARVAISDKVSERAAVRFGGLALPFLACAVAALAYGHPRVAFWAGYLALSYTLAAATFSGTTEPKQAQNQSNDRPVVFVYITAVVVSAVVYAVLGVRSSVRNALFVPAAVILAYGAAVEPRLTRMLAAPEVQPVREEEYYDDVGEVDDAEDVDDEGDTKPPA